MLKQCRVCGEHKDLSSFGKAAWASRDGLDHRCRDCGKNYLAEWRAKNPDSYRSWAAKNREHLQEKNRIWHMENREHRRAAFREWCLKNPVQMTMKAAMYKAANKRATPKWADRTEMRKVYERAREATLSTGIQHEVDHVIPLRGASVCGLNCEANLQILTRSQNARKRNKFVPFSLEIRA